jgi:hypothetical protein
MSISFDKEWKEKSSIKITDGWKENRTTRDCNFKFHFQLPLEKTTTDILTPSNEATKKNN